MKMYPLTSPQNMYILSDIFSFGNKRTREIAMLSFLAIATAEDGSTQESRGLAIEKAWNHVVRENDSLRLCFKGPLFYKKQYIADPQYLAFERQSFDGGLEELRQKLCGERRVIPWNSVPMWQGRLYFLTSGDVAAFITVHHTIADGYSFSLLFRQTDAAYREYIAGREPLLQERPSITRYFQFCRDYRKSNAFKDDLRYWFRAFNLRKGFRIVGGWSAADTSSDVLSLTLEGETAERLTALAAELGVTVQYLFQCLVAMETVRKTGYRDFSICSLIHGRMRYDQKKLIGCCVSHMPLFFNFAEADGVTAAEYVKSSYGQYIEAMTHARIPPGLFVPLSYKEAVFNKFNFVFHWMMFSSMDYGDDLQGSGALQFDVLPNRAQQFAFYVTFLHCADGKILVSLDYQKKKYPREKVETLVRDFIAFLGQVLEHPDEKLGALL